MTLQELFIVSAQSWQIFLPLPEPVPSTLQDALRPLGWQRPLWCSKVTRFALGMLDYNLLLQVLDLLETGVEKMVPRACKQKKEIAKNKQKRLVFTKSQCKVLTPFHSSPMNWKKQFLFLSDVRKEAERFSYHSHLVKAAECSEITNTHEFFERPVIYSVVTCVVHVWVVLDFSYQRCKPTLKLLAETVLYTFVTLSSAHVPVVPHSSECAM